MKRIFLVFGLLLCCSTASYASNVLESDPNFCSQFVEETFANCVTGGGGKFCSEATHDYEGMRRVYAKLMSRYGSTDHNLTLACTRATRRNGHPEEAGNCVIKWNCYLGTPVDSNCYPVNHGHAHC